MTFTKWALVLFLLPTAAIAALTSAERKSQFEKAMASIMAANTPSVSDDRRKGLLDRYLACKPNKGQAVELAGAGYFRLCEHEDASAVGERSLEACQLRFGKPCALLAVNEEIASEGALAVKDMPRLHYTGKFDLAKIPIVRDAIRKRPDVQVYDMAMEPKAMAIHPWGRLFISAGDPTVQDAQASALAKCNDDPVRKGRDGGCFVYAVNNGVIIDERRMQPK
jgi:hypothetical protein